MTDILQPAIDSPAKASYTPRPTRTLLLLGGCVVIVAITIWLAISFNAFQLDDPLFLDSTPAELAIWMTDQAEEDDPESWLGQYAQGRRETIGEDDFNETVLLNDMRNGFIIIGVILCLLSLFSAVGIFTQIRGHRFALGLLLIGLDILVFLIPYTSEDPVVPVILLGIVTVGLLLLFSSAHVERIIGFLVILSLFIVAWEAGKAFADQVNYRITAHVEGWEYQQYPDLETALEAVQSGDTQVLLADRRDIDELILPYPPEEDAEVEADTYADLRYIQGFRRGSSQLVFDVTPSLPGRISLIVPENIASEITSIDMLKDLEIGAVSESYVEESFLSVERELVILDLKILNDLNMPPLQSIAEALFQPARRNGPLLLVRILFEAALYTWFEAALGFAMGATLGFILGSVFAHIKILERSLLPYIVASQTVPIIALAPMIVIWLNDVDPILPVAVISAYLTFFPVTINTLRGLESPSPMTFDLMKSYAASKWEIMWKLRFPAALPYIFTALKVSATASVVGAIIGELPSGIGDGLGRTIINFSSDYSLISTPKLWASILMASLLGIFFFLMVSITEIIVLRGQKDTQ